MARTWKREWSNPDGFHLWHRNERLARPAGRDAKAFYEDLALDREEAA